MTNTYVVLLRAVNAGGVNSLQMEEFVQILGNIALEDVKIYIQTGNAAFHAREVDMTGLPEKIRVEIETRHGFTPGVVLFGLDEMKSAIARNPFPEAASDPKSVHLTFLASSPRTPDLTILESVRKSSERFALKGRVFYLHAPEGVARAQDCSHGSKDRSVLSARRVIGAPSAKSLKLPNRLPQLPPLVARLSLSVATLREGRQETSCIAAGSIRGLEACPCREIPLFGVWWSRDHRPRAQPSLAGLWGRRWRTKQ
jgi:uncharacterized protein (DUF1697 family)